MLAKTPFPLIKWLILIFIIHCNTYVFSQVKYLELTNKKTAIVKIMPEHTRIQIEVNSGLQLFGKFKIIDAKHIEIKRQLIAVEDISKLKRKTVFGQVAKWLSLGVGAFGGLGVIGVAIGGDILFVVAPLVISAIGFGSYFLLKKAYPYQHKKWKFQNITDDEY